MQKQEYTLPDPNQLKTTFQTKTLALVRLMMYNQVMKSCIKCNKEFKPRTIGSKHCSQKCYWESKIGTKNSYGNKISKGTQR